MTRSRLLTLLAGAAVLSLTALALAACGGSSSATAGSATVDVASTDVGEVLVDSQGHTLYVFKKDTGTMSTCAGACAANWPPLRANGTPTAGSGTKPSLVATSTRSDGGSQVTYNGHPVYRYSGDAKPGDTAGQGLTTYGGAWYALAPAGTPVSAKPSTSSSDGSSNYYGGGNGY
jgi:predicted lipoprotein with Yx(FWY)xxD motif